MRHAVEFLSVQNETVSLILAEIWFEFRLAINRARRNTDLRTLDEHRTRD